MRAEGVEALPTQGLLELVATLKEWERPTEELLEAAAAAGGGVQGSGGGGLSGSWVLRITLENPREVEMPAGLPDLNLLL